MPKRILHYDRENFALIEFLLYKRREAKMKKTDMETSIKLAISSYFWSFFQMPDILEFLCKIEVAYNAKDVCIEQDRSWSMHSVASAGLVRYRNSGCGVAYWVESVWNRRVQFIDNKAEYSALDASRRRLREGVTDEQTEGRTDPLIEMRGRI